MFRPGRISTVRSVSSSQLIRQSQRPQRRLVSFTPPAQKPRSLKNGLARWALAAGGLYWYTTRDVDVFAEDARSRLSARQRIEPTYEESEELPTVDTVAAVRRQRREALVRDAKRTEPPSSPPPQESPAAPAKEEAVSAPFTQPPTSVSVDAAPAVSAEPASKEEQPATSPPSEPTAVEAAEPPPPPAAASSAETSPPEAAAAAAAAAVPPAPGSLEEEAEAEGAFNEETGEINWDCPCLGGMAHGPCGEQFRDAFSCFVFSKEEPKGIDCIERFKTMQECFREHPDVYGEELRDVDEDHDEAAGGEAAPAMQRDASEETAAKGAESRSEREDTQK